MIPAPPLALAGLVLLGGSHVAPLSPERVAFTSRRDGNWELYVADTDGDRQLRLTTRDEQDRFPLWSPDGSRIAFVSSRDGTRLAFISDRDGYEALYVVDADGKHVRRLTTTPSLNPSWAP